MSAIILFRPNALHIPDGFLSLLISGIFWVLTILFIGIALRKTRGEFSERQIPLMGVMAAFIFAAQMINFPVAGGTSGHMLGGALAAITLGPWAGMLVMTAVITVQALVFQDGGLIVMGANIFNMGLLTALLGHGVYRLTADQNDRLQLAGAGAAAWLSVMAGALMTAIQLWLSGTTSANLVFPAMMSIHALIGIGEAFITIAAVNFIFRTRPDILTSRPHSHSNGWSILAVFISILVVLLSPYASTNPDGLERVALDLGFSAVARTSTFEILSDYSIPILGNSAISTILAGVIGVIVLLLLFTVFRSRRSQDN